MDGYGKRVLVVDGDEDLRCAVGAVLSRHAMSWHLAVEAGEVFPEVQKRRFDDRGRRPCPADGCARLVRLGRALCPNTPIIFVSAELSLLMSRPTRQRRRLPFGELDRLRLQATVRAAASVCGRPPFLEVQA
ncbi:MAG: hypothetical protein U0361_20695 [Nitrospiraceae bacterium]